MKLNRNFGKLENETLTYAPAILRVVTHHHEEWDEPVIDPETGEPTGETVPKSRDYDTYETKMWPTAEDYAKMGWLRVVDEMPSEEPQEGFRWEAKEWALSGALSQSQERSLVDGVDTTIVHSDFTDQHIRRVYEQVANPPPPRTFSKLKCVAALMEAGVWHEVKSYIEGAGLYDLYLAAQDFREDNPYFTSGKAQLMTSLGWTEEQAEALLSQCVIGY